MPPKRGVEKEDTSNNAPTESAEAAAPPPSEDAKPNVDELNAAAAVASSEAELPSDPSAPAPQPDPISVNTTPAQSARSTPSLQQSDPPGRATPASGPSTRGKRPLAAPRGAGRRSQAKREELQRADDERRRQEAQQRAQEEAAKAKAQGKWGGGRGRGRGDFRGGRGKGRGGYVGESERHKKDGVASGPFSGGEITKDKRSSGKWRTSGGISRGAQVGFHAGRRQSGAEPAEGESGTFTTGLAPPKQSSRPAYTSSNGGSRSRTAHDGTQVKPDPDSKPALDADGDIRMIGTMNGGSISSDEDEGERDDGRRFNIENLIDLTREDDEYDAMQPVRVVRKAHKKRTLGINADGATNKEGNLAVGANDAASSQKRKGKQKEEPQQAVELSSGSDREADQSTQPTIKPDPDAPSAAEEMLQEPQLAGGASNLDDLPQEPPSSPESKRKGKERIKARTMSSTSQPDRPDLQTQEEIEEWERNQLDLRILRNELGQPAPTTTAEGEDTPEDKRKDKVYLFQFPPVLPDLAPLAIKPDPEAPQPDAMDIDSGKGKGSANSKDNPIDVADGGASTQPKLPSGLVGKLNIHKSGRATLDWGGTSFCLGMGAEASFLQDILVARVPDRKGGEEAGSAEEDEAVAMSMGQVKGKFVVTPDWDEILG